MAENRQSHAERLTRLFERVLLRGIARHSLTELDGEDLSLPQLQCLCFLMQHRRSRLGHISEGLSISNPAVTKLIDRLVKKGLVTSTPCSCDRRSVEVDLTDEGLRLIKQFRSLRSQRLDAIMNSMNPSDREMFLQGLERFLDAALENETDAQEACLYCGTEHDPDCIVHRAGSRRV